MNRTRLVSAAVLIGALLTAVTLAGAPAAGAQTAIAPQPGSANRGWDDGATYALGAPAD